MDLLSILLIAIGLAMDSLAISFTSGGILHRFKWKEASLIAGFMGIFQGIMPLIGWTLGLGFKELICEYDHWIAFGILFFLGGKMIFDSFAPEEERTFNPLQISVLLGLAIATSIDAMAVGLSFAFLSIPILVPFTIIGVVTFLICLSGVYAGSILGKKINFPLEIIGGIILIIIGIRIVIEHTYLS